MSCDTEEIANDRLNEIFESLVTAEGRLNAHFLQIAPNKSIDSTGASFSCHMIRIDASGKDRTDEIAKYVASRIVDYAIPRSRIIKAQEHLARTNSTSEYSILEKEARSLFTDIKNTGECGEILLYIFANEILAIPQVLCKMPLKTNPEVHYHGIDGMHAKYDEKSNCLLLFWGESKVYSNLQQAFSECFDSISKMLLSDNSTGAPAQRDLQLFRDNIDLNNLALEKTIMAYLDPNNENNLRLRHCGICLIGFDEKAYKDKITENEVKSELNKHIESWGKSLLTRINKKNLRNFTIEIFLIPFPSVSRYRDAFLREIGLGKVRK